MKWLYAPRTIDYAMRATRTEHLVANPRAYVAYEKLERHYWHCGRLYREDHELAAAAGLAVHSFRRVKPLLVRLFDVDPDGLWRDFDLERERDDAILGLGLGEPADFQPQPEAGVAPGADGGAGTERTPRSAANRANAVLRWRLHRERQAEQGRGKSADTEAMRFASDTMRNGMRNGTVSDANGTAGRMESASSHSVPGLEEDDEDSKKTSSSSSFTLPDGRERDANDHAISHPVSHSIDAKSDAKRGQRAVTAAQAMVSNRELRDALLRAIGDNVEQACRDLHSVKPIRELMREGCDLERHILPELRQLAKSSRRLQTWRASWLHQQIRDRRDAPPDEAESPGVKPATTRIFVEKGTPMWEAWMAYRSQCDGKPFTLSYTRGGKEGWDFDALWPPGFDPSRVAAE